MKISIRFLFEILKLSKGACSCTRKEIKIKDDKETRNESSVIEIENKNIDL